MTLEQKIQKVLKDYPILLASLEDPQFKNNQVLLDQKELVEIIQELQQKNDLLQLEADKWKYLRENALNKAFDLAILNAELQEKVDYQEVALQESKEIISCYKVEQDEWKERFLQERRIKHKEYDTAKFKLDFLQGELISALHYIRSCDNATQSAAKAIEMLKKYEI